MSSDLDQTLCERYPAIFAGRSVSLEVSCMGRGFACGNGWFDLIDSLCECLQRESDAGDGPQVVAAQVKEKLGGLRFVACGISDRQRAMIDLAQAHSFRICESCGASGSLRADAGVMRTRCAKHAGA